MWVMMAVYETESPACARTSISFRRARAKKEETDSWKLFAFWDPKTLMRAQIVVKTYVAVLTAFWTILI
jgi:hypothetical protein